MPGMGEMGLPLASTPGVKAVRGEGGPLPAAETGDAETAFALVVAFGDSALIRDGPRSSVRAGLEERSEATGEGAVGDASALSPAFLAGSGFSGSQLASAPWGVSSGITLACPPAPPCCSSRAARSAC